VRGNPLRSSTGDGGAEPVAGGGLARAGYELSELWHAPTQGGDGNREGTQPGGVAPARDGGVYPGAGESGGGGSQAVAASRRASGARACAQAHGGERELAVAGGRCPSVRGAAGLSADRSREGGRL